jgi:transposase InsO family protein
MARREVEDLLRRYRRALRRRRRRLSRVLHWSRPGAVWAVDFSEPPLPIEGRYPRLLAVRDLASGYQLLWLPVADETAHTACDGLHALFRQHGAPLVLKSDNGSGLAAGALEALLAGWGVWQLFSPVRTPEYNGSCEAGIGSMKTRTHHQAALRGTAGEWTCDDTEAARQQANQTARPHGLHGPTPEEVWTARTPIGDEERRAFADTAVRTAAEARQEQGYPPQGEIGPMARAAVHRVALRRALVAHGLLSFTASRRAPRGVPPSP